MLNSKEEAIITFNQFRSFSFVVLSSIFDIRCINLCM